MITVRVATPEDAQSYEETWQSAMDTLRETYRTSPGFLDNWTPPSDLTKIAAVLDGRVVGVVQCYPEEDRMHIMRFGVRSDCRGKGVGRALIAFVADLARRKGFRCLDVYTIKETGSVPIYKALGFTVLSEEAAKWAESDKYDKLTDVHLQKPL
jgi:ribosomal protein S18 acetylase RimI-like enzyme